MRGVAVKLARAHVDPEHDTGELTDSEVKHKRGPAQWMEINLSNHPAIVGGFRTSENDSKGRFTMWGVLTLDSCLGSRNTVSVNKNCLVDSLEALEPSGVLCPRRRM